MAIVKGLKTAKIFFPELKSNLLYKPLFISGTFLIAEITAVLIGYTFYISSPFAQKTFIELSSLSF